MDKGKPVIVWATNPSAAGTNFKNEHPTLCEFGYFYYGVEANESAINHSNTHTREDKDFKLF